MALEIAKLDEHIQSLREGNTLTENEVKALCDKVRARTQASNTYKMNDLAVLLNGAGVCVSWISELYWFA